MSTETKIGKMKHIVEGGVQTKQEVMLQEVDVSTQFDFLDGYLQQVLIEYNSSTDELTVFLSDHDARRESQPVLQCHVKLAECVKLDNGAAHLGFC